MVYDNYDNSKIPCNRDPSRRPVAAKEECNGVIKHMYWLVIQRQLKVNFYYFIINFKSIYVVKVADSG